MPPAGYDPSPSPLDQRATREIETLYLRCTYVEERAAGRRDKRNKKLYLYLQKRLKVNNCTLHYMATRPER
jgi:hypothetical protein